MMAVWRVFRRALGALSAVGLIATTAHSVPGAEVSAKPSIAPLPVAKVVDDCQDLIYFAPRGPIVIRLHVHVDGLPLTEFRNLIAKQIFESLDADKNGLLEKKELEQIPNAMTLRVAARPQQGRQMNSSSSSLVDASAQSDHRSKGKPVTLDDLTALVLNECGTPFAMAIDGPANQQQVFFINGMRQGGALDMAPFLAQIDTDRDGRISAAEFAGIDGLYRMLDRNDDETISRNEIATANASGALGASASNPLTGLATLLQPIDRWGSRKAMAYELIQLYDRTTRKSKTSRGARDKKLSPTELGRPAAELARFDKNGDGLLDATEAAQWLGNPTPQFELDVELAKKSLKKPTIDVRPASTSTRDSDLSVRAGKAGEPILQIGSLPIEMQASESSGKMVFPSGRYKNVFRNADQNQNKYLEPNELGLTGQGLNPADFPAVDRDGNGMVFEDEWLAFLKLRDNLADQRIALTVASTSTDPVTQFDSNGDSRLSRAELIRALQTIKSWDVNHDGRIASDEIPRHFHGTFQVGSGDSGQRRPAMAMPMNAPSASPAKDAPSWFQKMDRNRDGEVSFREFLGPLAMFRRLDANQDGALSVQESRATTP